MFRALGMILFVSVAACAAPDEFTPPTDSYDMITVRVGAESAGSVAARVHAAFFGATLPILGRLPSPQEHADGSPVVVLSHAYWTEAHDALPNVIGSQLNLDGVPHTVVGVMPDGIDVPPGVTVWIPR